jgi:hypothetical protein
VSTPSNNQYAPPRSTVADIRAVDEDFVKASRLSRLGAVIIDGLIGEQRRCCHDYIADTIVIRA